MGFFDFITKSPIGGILKTLAPIVSSAIPVVGPVINAALPALDGILSHDSTQTPDFAKPPPPPDQPPSPPFKLEDLLKPITTQFQATETLIKGVQESVDNLSQEMKTGFTKVESHIDAAITAAQQKQEIRDDHKTNMSLVNKITIAQKWIDNNGDALSKMTPKSGDSVFDQFLKSGEPEYLPLARKQLYSEVIIPLQQQLSTRPYLETVDTYLLALHWLLILDKALIVMHGYRARNLYVYQRWQLYLDSLLKLSNAIGKLREDANEAIQTLSKLVATVQTGRANKIRFPKVAEKAFIQDDWPMLTIGYVHIPDFEAKDELLPKLSANYDANATTAQYATYLLYREAAEHALRIHLEPVKAVITDLCNLVPVWNSRLPPAPKVDKQINHVEILNSSNEKPSPSGAKISFAVTYLSSQGESSESPWTDPVFMTGGNTEIKISVRSVTTAYDPTASLERMRDPKTDTPLPSSRGVARCVYAKISFNETLEYHHLGIFADQFDETEKLVSGQSGSATIVVTNMEET